MSNSTKSSDFPASPSSGGTMSRACHPIELYFDFISPFGWFAAERIGSVAKRLGRRVIWCPILLKATVVDCMGLPPMLDVPLKGDYVRRDATRCARYYGLSMASDPVFSFSSVNALRAVLWCRRHSQEDTEKFILALYRRRWRDGEDISRIASVVEVARQLGLLSEALSETLSRGPIREELRDEIARATSKGVFGSPTMVVDGELFWGADRLDMMAAWIERGGW